MCRKLLVFLVLSNLLVSQNTSNLYNDGLNCFLNKDYVCAQNYFSQIITDNHNSSLSTFEYAHYYHYLSSLKLYNKNTELLFNDFIENFPLSNKKNDAVFFMSEYLFEKKQYKQVIHLLRDLNLYQLGLSKKDRAFFYLGYSCYVVGKYDLATSSFYELMTNFTSPYRDDAIFYNSHILLNESFFKESLSGFELLKNSDKFKRDVPYFISKILFDLSQYEQLINYLEPLIDSDTFNYIDDLVLFLAKAFYHLEEYDKAIVYFEEYKLSKEVLTEDQLYQIGFSYYKKGLYGFAINHLNKITLSQSDTISQYAFYYLGASYRKTNNILESMNAFKSAADCEADGVIQHDAFYHFVVMCYENGHPLYDTVDYLHLFLDKYPESKYVDKIYTYLANTYINSNNYDDAISALEKSDFLNPDIRDQYQKICFSKAIQLYNDFKYDDAILYLNKSISVSNNSDLLYSAYYWRAEAFYKLNNYSKALESFQYIPSKHSLYAAGLYSQGYCYMKEDDYMNAINVFMKSVSYYNNNSQILHDIYARIGDSYFLIQDYSLSAKYFNNSLLIEGFQGDYVSYKKSTSYVLLEDYNKAIESFIDLIDSFPESNYVDDALFDLGNVYILNKNFDLAINIFSKITLEFPNSLFFSMSKLKMGLIYYMQNEDQNAINILKKVIIDFPQTTDSEQALSILKNIYNDIGQADQFLDFIKNVDHDYTAMELDSSTYHAAELQYLQSNYQSSISSFDSYLEYYPDGLFVLNANYYLYKSHYELDQKVDALNYLDFIISDKENQYTVEALMSSADIYYELEKFISSELYFSKLLKLAPSIDVKRKAVLGLLQSKFYLYKYEDVINDIESLVEEDLFSGQENIRIHYLSAYSYYQTEQYDQSLTYFQWLTSNSDGEVKAESYFYSASILYKQKKYEKTQTILFQLIKELPNYEKWIHEALLLLAQNYIAQEDMFQAQHLLLELEKKPIDNVLKEKVQSLLENNFSNTEQDVLINQNE